jgi:hypothetical protein
MYTIRLPLGLLLGVLFCRAAIVQAAAASGPPTAPVASGAAADPLQQGFAAPGDAYKPWAYWWWLKGNVSESSITSDLEAMKRTGFSGCLLFDARGYHESHVPPPESRMEFMSPQWRRMFKFALGEAHRLGLQMSVNLSSCAGALKGPWEVGDDAPKRLLWVSAEVRGPRQLKVKVPRPEGARSRDVALLAARCAKPSAAAPTATAAVEWSASWQGVAQDARRLLYGQLLRQAARLVPGGGAAVAFGVRRPVGPQDPGVSLRRPTGVPRTQRHAGSGRTVFIPGCNGYVARSVIRLAPG